MQEGGSDVTSSAVRASLTDRSAVSDKAATLSLDHQLERDERRYLETAVGLMGDRHAG